MTITFTEIDAAAAFQSVAALWMAIVATVALNTWKKQSIAQRKTDYLDALTEAVHDFILAMERPAGLLQIVDIEIDSRVIADASEPESRLEAAIRLIESGHSTAAQLMLDAISEVQPKAARLRALVAKGQVFEFDEFGILYDACQHLLWQMNRTQALGQMLVVDHMNWKNEKVRETLSGALRATPADVGKHLSDHNVVAIDYVRREYKKLYN